VFPCSLYSRSQLAFIDSTIVLKLTARFYTLLVIGTALFDQPPWKNLIVNGLVLAA
jgi:hypothetical protein